MPGRPGRSRRPDRRRSSVRYLTLGRSVRREREQLVTPRMEDVECSRRTIDPAKGQGHSARSNGVATRGRSIRYPPAPERAGPPFEAVPQLFCLARSSRWIPRRYVLAAARQSGTSPDPLCTDAGVSSCPTAQHRSDGQPSSADKSRGPPDVATVVGRESSLHESGHGIDAEMNSGLGSERAETDAPNVRVRHQGQLRALHEPGDGDLDLGERKRESRGPSSTRPLSRPATTR